MTNEARAAMRNGIAVASSRRLPINSPATRPDKILKKHHQCESHLDLLLHKHPFTNVEGLEM